MRTCFLFTVLVGLLIANHALADDHTDQVANHDAAIGSISGHVADAKGLPLLGAQVLLHQFDEAHGFGPANGMSKVDASGSFRFADLAPGHYVVTAEAEGLAASRLATVLLKGQQQNFEIALRPVVRGVIRFQTESGSPVAGVTLRDLRYRDANGEFYPSWPAAQNMASLGMKVEPSTASGLLNLPPLPEGAVITTAIFDHADFAPLKINDVTATSGEITTVTMHPGVKLTLKVVPQGESKAINNAVVRIVHSDSHNPSTLLDAPILIGDDGTATLMVEPGKYALVRLEHEDEIITPLYDSFEIGPGQNDTLTFMVHSKVKACGRVIDSDTGKPIGDVRVFAEIPNQPASGWTMATGAETNAQGQYVLQVPPGPVRVYFNNLYANHRATVKPYIEAEVRADGSTILPDLKLFSIPKPSGRVVDPDGKPVAGAIARLQGTFRLARMAPVATDGDGRFELVIDHVPDGVDLAAPQLLDVFDPTKPFSVRTEIHLDQPKSLENMTVQLKPESYGEFLKRSIEPIGDSERNRFALLAERAKLFPSLIGKPAPELDGLVWINAEKPMMSLADFRGKYVLLDFWAVWCGPCHADFPDVKLLYDAYKDHGLVVIGVHDNSTDADLVREHAKQQGLTFPIVVDQRDGRTYAAYQKFGTALGIPSYVLIGPDGTILQTGALANHRFEYVRNYLFGGAQSP